MAQDQPGSKSLDWANLGFQLQPTEGHVEVVWKDGSWSRPQMVKEPFMKLHVNSVALHYGQAIFEGLKAFHCKDGSVRVFADHENHARINRGAERMLMPEVSLELWRDALDMVVRTNVSCLPPYGSGGALYIRPLLFGSGPQLGNQSAKEFHLIITATAVSSYYAGAGDLLKNGAPGKVVMNYDRASSRGVGDVKCAGNYAVDLKPSTEWKKEGFVLGLYLDSVEQKYVEEFNVTNFAAITKDRKYITPESPSVLASITNKCLQVLARDMGLQVEKRRIEFLKEVDSFQEVAGVGTAAVLLPIKSLTLDTKTFNFGQADVMRKLSDTLQGIQCGALPDRHGWTRKVDLTKGVSRL